MSTFVLGKDCKLYFGTAGETLVTNLTELDNAKDVTVNLDSGEADVTTRANSGWRATAQTLKECSIELEMLWKPGDAGFGAVKSAYLGGTTVALAALTGANDASDSEGPLGDFSITSFSRNEPLEEGVTVSVTAKLAVFTQWVVVA